ncbi:MAG: hypothetical protein JXD22_10820 [Sedimentisphaerales bacterium]|nr:hypothetical protein [Sedimentisphaerales bacterium]
MRLTRKEQLLSIGLAGLIAFWIMYAFVVNPALARLQTLRRAVPEKLAVMQEINIKSHQFLKLQHRLELLQQQITSQPKDFVPVRFLENLIDQCRLSDHVLSLETQSQQLDENYAESIVTIELNDVTLKQLVQFLSNLRSASPLLQIKTLDIRKNPAKPHLLNSTIYISHFKQSD